MPGGAGRGPNLRALPSCRTASRNLCDGSRFTGWTDDGGYAQFIVLPQAYAYRLPERSSDEQATPLLCAGIIGFRALRRSGFQPGQRLGIWGYGGSAHLTAQIALALGAELHVVIRDDPGRALAREQGASWVGARADGEAFLRLADWVWSAQRWATRWRLRIRPSRTSLLGVPPARQYSS